MRQLAFYLTLLYCAYCAHCDYVPATLQSAIKHDPSSDARSEKSCQSWERENKEDLVDGNQHKDGAMIMSKPKLVVTFLANTRAIDRIDNNEFGGGLEPPFFLDPFQRLLQFFFSSFARDFSPRFPSQEDADVVRDVAAAKDKVENSTDFDWLGKKEEPKMYCDHGTNGFCRSCHMKARNMLDMEPFKVKREMTTMSKHDLPVLAFNISYNNLLATDKLARMNVTRNATIPIGSPATATATSPTSASSTSKRTSTKKKSINVRHKRHYFLSISGDTVQRVAAPKSSEHKRAKRNATQDNPSLFKILEETIYESLNKDAGNFRKQGTEEPKDDETDQSTHAGDDSGAGGDSSSGGSDGSNEDGDNDNNEFFEFGITPHEAEYSHGWAYFFLVTLPVTCTFAVIILFMCIFLRTRGWCCKLFLKDPAKTLEERSAKKKKNKTTKKKGSQIIMA